MLLVWLASRSCYATAGVSVRMSIIVVSQSRQRALTVVNVSTNVQIAADPNGPVVEQFEVGTCLMYQPHFPARSGWWTLLARKYAPNNYPVFSRSLLSDHKHLISWSWRAYHSPAGAYPRRQDRKPAAQDAFGLERQSRRPCVRIDRCDSTEPWLGLSLDKGVCVHLHYVQELIHFNSQYWKPTLFSVSYYWLGSAERIQIVFGMYA